MIGDVSIAKIDETIAGSATNKKTNGEVIEEATLEKVLTKIREVLAEEEEKC